jgi:hypothetical protein
LYLKHPTRDPRCFIEPSAHVIGELNATIQGLALTDRFCVRPIQAAASMAAYGRFETAYTFFLCLSLRNQLLLKQALQAHDLVFWSPHTGSEIKN